ncbi:S53 family peptidase [Aquisphaera giovannonii]|uniref:S53 family peptidase n=1 Tax=Aquisphaera giovannonii TaxID=406548 RepID=UPI00143DB55C|nr:S53 family peptidase [Aquisphaera giovannonii]
MLSTAASALDNIVARPSLDAAPLVANLNPTGLSVAQVRAAYGMNQVTFQGGTIAGNGAGQTIAIVTAYDAPTIGSDLRAFDRMMGLPDPPSFLKYSQRGTKVDGGWATETALDVEWAHAMAPGANIVLVEARSAGLKDLLNAVNLARSISGVSVISMSWGTNEFRGQTAYDSVFTTPAGHIGGSGLPGGISFVAASGDSGAWGGVSYPSTSPYVLAVGGTSLYLGADGGYGSEAGWRWSTGGYSSYEPAPAYQVAAQAASGVSYGVRTTPDVSAISDPATGIAVYSSVPYGGTSGWFAVGGTSAATPMWAGIVAVADQGLALAGRGSISNVQAELYAIPSSAYNSVSVGFNGYNALAGYDLVTGLGTPSAVRLIADLAAGPGGTSGGGGTARVSSSLKFRATRLDVAVASGIPGTTPVGTTQGLFANTTTAAAGPVSTVLAPNTVVIVIPLGSGQFVVIVERIISPPLPSATASAHVENALATEIDSTNPGFTNLLSTSRILPFDRLVSASPARYDGPDVESLIDLVLPPEVAPAGPVAPAPAAATVASRPASPPVLERAAFGLLPSGPEEAALDARLDAPALGGRPSLPALPAEAEDGEARGAPAPRLAGAFAMAGGAAWLAWKDVRRQARPQPQPSAPRALRPKLRRLLLPVA